MDLTDPAVIEELERLQAAELDPTTAGAAAAAPPKAAQPPNVTRIKVFIYVFMALFFMWRVSSLGIWSRLMGWNDMYEDEL